MPHHYAGDDLVVRKIRVGSMGNNTYVLECPETHDALLVDACTEPDKIMRGCHGANMRSSRLTATPITLARLHTSPRP